MLKTDWNWCYAVVEIVPLIAADCTVCTYDHNSIMFLETKTVTSLFCVDSVAAGLNLLSMPLPITAPTGLLYVLQCLC